MTNNVRSRRLVQWGFVAAVPAGLIGVALSEFVFDSAAWVWFVCFWVGFGVGAGTAWLTSRPAR
ncbi:hypothetical protein [uncultured Cellulomonas sp.]|uniref:hypothetical protein n=1 Tax=uncultured Cellulomonas sp. TaxID=189682 RepID=UPI00260B9ADB|nr:hypothetical protein [uncultured Cellulomonas sp.]